MNLLKPKTLEELIISYLTKREYFAVKLFSELCKHEKCTKQGFYKALRNLQKEEVILIYKKKVSLDSIWLKKMQELLLHARNQNIETVTSFDVLKLEDKESVTYSFSTIRNLDTYWGHLQSILMRKTSPHDAIFSYDPHYWFYIVRKEREKELLREITEHKRQFLMTVGGSLPLDKLIKTDFNTDYLQYNYNKMFDKRNYYITVIGEYVTEVTLDTRISEKIDRLYEKAQVADTETLESLRGLLSLKSSSKIKISRNKHKTLTLQKKMQKDFYIIKKQLN